MQWTAPGTTATSPTLHFALCQGVEGESGRSSLDRSEIVAPRRVYSGLSISETFANNTQRFSRPLKSRIDSTAVSILTSNNPLKFAGGLGLNHLQIGLITTVYGIFGKSFLGIVSAGHSLGLSLLSPTPYANIQWFLGMVVQFTLFPLFARRFGVLNCLKACAIAFPIANFLIPFTALLPTLKSQVAGLFAVLLIKCWYVNRWVERSLELPGRLHLRKKDEVDASRVLAKLLKSCNCVWDVARRRGFSFNPACLITNTYADPLYVLVVGHLSSPSHAPLFC